MALRLVKPTLQLDGGVLVPAAAGAGKVLTSDASGNGTWQTPSGGAAGGTASIPAVIGDGSTRVFTITHNLGSQEVQTIVRQTASPFEAVFPTVANTTTNTVTLTFATAPSTNQFTVTCQLGVPSALLTTTNGPWQNVSALGFNNSWAVGSVTPQYMVDALGFVHCQGKLKSGANGTQAFTFPVGFRPAQSVEIWGAQDGTTGVAFVIAANGSVVAYCATATTNEISLDEIVFLAASPVLLSSAPQLVTSLPASPTDGQLIDFLADATNGVIWRFRYRAAATGLLKWEFVGGSPLASTVAGSDSITSTVYADPPTNPGPSVVLPSFANGGDYVISIAAQQSAGVNQYTSMAVKLGAAATSDNESVVSAQITTAAINQTGARTMRRNGIAGGATLKMQYSTLGGSSAVFRRDLLVTPVRVG